MSEEKIPRNDLDLAYELRQAEIATLKKSGAFASVEEDIAAQKEAWENYKRWRTAEEHEYGKSVQHQGFVNDLRELAYQAYADMRDTVHFGGEGFDLDKYVEDSFATYTDTLFVPLLEYGCFKSLPTLNECETWMRPAGELAEKVFVKGGDLSLEISELCHKQCALEVQMFSALLSIHGAGCAIKSA